MNSQDYYRIPVTVMFPESMWTWIKVEAWKLNKSNSEFICDIICKFYSKKYSVKRSLKAYSDDFADKNTKGHQVKFTPVILNQLNQVTNDFKEYRSTIICCICYRSMR